MEDALPPKDADLLVEHGRFARELARGLLRDEHLAEDLAQDAWIAARENPPDRGMRAWLRAVVRNMAANLLRGAARRGARERAAARRGSLPSAGEIAARAETLRRVAEAVLALEEPYRTTVLLRYYDDLPPAAIARLQGVPASTVRTRLQRAHERLRARLDESHGRDRRAWTLVLLPLAGPATGSPPPAGPGAAATGGLLVAKKSVVAATALILLLGGAGYLALRPAGRGDAPAGLRDPAARGPAAPPRATVAVAGPPAEAASPPSPREVSPAGPLPAAAPRQAWRLRGRLLGFDPASGAEPAVVEVGVITTREDPPPPAALRVGATGTFDADVTALATAKGAAELELRLDHPAYLPVSTRVPLGAATVPASGGERALAADLRLLRAFPVRGRVVDGAGRAVAEADVAAFPVLAGGPDPRPSDRATSGPDGTFTLRLGSGERYLLAAARDGLRPAVVEVRGRPVEAPDLVLREGARLAGTVTRNGAPVPGARVAVRPAGERRLSLALGPRTVRGTEADPILEEVEATTGADGSYRADGLPAGPCRVVLQDIAGARIHPDVSAWQELDARAPATGADLALETAEVVLEVRAGERHPGKASVLVDGTTPEEEPIGCGIGVGEDGRAAFSARPGAEYDVVVSARGFLEGRRRIRAGAAGSETRERFDLVPGSATSRVLRIALRGEGAASLARAAVGWFEPGNDGYYPDVDGGTVDVRGGVLETADPPAGRWRLVVRPGGPWIGGGATWLDTEAAVEIGEGGVAPLELPLRPGGRLRIAARDAEGRFLQARCVLSDAAGRRMPVWFTIHHGEGNWSGGAGSLPGDAPAVVDPALPPGTYRADLRLDGYLDRSEEVRVEAGAWTDLEVTLERR